MDAQAARAAAEKLIELLEPHVEWIEVAGSLRRGKDDVKDVEIVAIPGPGFWDYTDRLVVSGTIAKADYGGQVRWGQKYRGLIYEGARVEIFLCDQNNRGWIFFLRTGPGSMNQSLVTRIKKLAPFTVRDGYIWHGERKLRINTEADWFKLLGIPWIEPSQRDNLMKAFAPPHHWGDPEAFALPHTITIYTAQMHMGDPDALDITFKSGREGDGAILAPTSTLVYGHKAFKGDTRFVGQYAPIDDDEYTKRYLAMLRERYSSHAEFFHKLLDRERLVLKCYCPAGDFCHRHIAVDVLTKIAQARNITVVPGGEIIPEPKAEQQTLFDLPTIPRYE